MHFTRQAALAAALVLADISAATAQQWSDEKGQVADALATKILQDKAKPLSVVMGVTIGGIPRFTKGYGVVSQNNAVKPNEHTHYQIGSLSKQLTAAGVLGLMEDQNGLFSESGSPAPGKFALDTNLADIVPEASGWTPKGPVTIRNLLNMRSGFFNYTNFKARGIGTHNTTKSATPDVVLGYIDNMMKAQPQAFVPGTYYEYSNTNYFLLASAIENVLPHSPGFPKVNYRRHIADRVFKRAGMSETGFVGAFPGMGGVAETAYDTIASQWNKPSWPKGAGEVVSTASDILKWHAALMTGSVISKGALKVMFNAAAPVPASNPPEQYAMGWAVTSYGGFDWYAHNGWIAGYSSYDGIYLNTKNGRWVSVVILTSGDQMVLNNPAICLARAAMDGAAKFKDMNAFAQAVCKQP